MAIYIVRFLRCVSFCSSLLQGNELNLTLEIRVWEILKILRQNG